VVTVYLTVTPVDDAPVARDGAVALDEDGALVFDLRDLGYDIDSTSRAAEVLGGPMHGTLEHLADGTYRYRPALDLNGDDQSHFRLGDGESVSNDATLHITVRPVNDDPNAPQLQLRGDTVQRRVFSTDWESAPNVSSQSTLVSGGVFEGWNLITGTDMHGMGQGLGGGKDGFEIWSSGDQMVDAYDRVHTVNAAADGGSNWLEINDAGGARFRTLGIARQVTTEKGASYNLSFDLAGRLGLGANTTRIAVYVDNVRIASFDNTSGNSALDWQHASASFIGNGGKQVIRIVTDASDRDMGGRGMMVDNIALDETVQLNHGRQGGTVLLQGGQAGLADTDGSERLALTLAGLPAGTTIGDGMRSFTVTEQAPARRSWSMWKRWPRYRR
jgi:hypothetical protein